MLHTHTFLPLHLLYVRSHGNDVLRHHKVGLFFFSLDLSIEHCIFTIQARKYDNFIFFKIFLESSESSDTSSTTI